MRPHLQVMRVHESAMATATATVGATPEPTKTSTNTLVPRTREIGITRLSAPSVLARGSKGTVTVEVENEGTSPENFTLAVTRTLGNRTVLIGSEDVSNLPPGQKLRLTQVWQTSAQDEPASYIVSARVSELPNETDLANNRRSVPVVVQAKT